MAAEAESTEEQLKTDKRKLLRDFREAQQKIDELETENSFLEMRIQKLKNEKLAIINRNWKWKSSFYETLICVLRLWKQSSRLRLCQSINQLGAYLSHLIVCNLISTLSFSIYKINKVNLFSSSVLYSFD